MGHPIHLHGHKFWVLGSGSGQFPHASVDAAPSSMINLHNPPYRDTTDLPMSGWLAIRSVLLYMDKAYEMRLTKTGTSLTILAHGYFIATSNGMPW